MQDQTSSSATPPPPSMPSSHTYNHHPALSADESSHHSTSSSSSSSFPSFYSPRPTAPTPRTIPDFDLNHTNSSANQSPSLPPSTPADNHHEDRSEGTQTPLYNPPPSLLSPAFTPPATPGTSTPDLLQRQPRGVPVDSTDPVHGGVPAGRPRLLEQLPEVRCIVRARIPTTTGTEMFLHLYQNNIDNKEHLAIVFGNQIRSRSLDAVRPGETEMDRMIRGAYTGRLYPGRTSSRIPSPLSNFQSATSSSSSSSAPTSTDTTTTTSDDQRQDEDARRKQIPLVRIHSECYTGETAWSARCDCGEQLDEAARLMSLPSTSSKSDIVGGAIIYLRQEGRGIGLRAKLQAYNLQDLGSDTVEANLLLRHPADARSYGLATAILLDLGLREVRLLTNNPEKVRAVEGPGGEVRVRERVGMVPRAWRRGHAGEGVDGVDGPEVRGYLRTKIEKMGHLLSLDEGGV